MDNNTKITAEHKSLDNAKEKIQSAIQSNDYLKALFFIFKVVKVRPNNTELVGQLQSVRSVLRTEDEDLILEIKSLINSKQ